MKLTKSQKIYAGILGVTLVGLTADRLMLAPSAAEARGDDAVLAPGALAAASSLSDRPAPAPAGAGSRLARELPARLRAVATEQSIDFTDVGNPFAVPPAWLPDDAMLQVDSAETRSLQDEFRQRHTLNAVLAGPSGDYAMIDGKARRLGDRLDGYTIVEIEPRRITLDRNGARITLSLATR